MTTLHPCRRIGLDHLDRAPTVFSNSVDVALPPQALFDFLARADTWPLWASVITHVEYTSPEPHGVGTTRTVTMRGGLVGEEEFLAWEPGVRLAFRFNAASTRALDAFLEDYRIVPRDGGSRLTWTLVQELRGPSRWFAPVTAVVADRVFRRFLRNLRRVSAAHVAG